MNSVNLLGRLTRDIEIKLTTNSKKFATFCIAVNAGKDLTYFIDCIAWEKTAENIGNFFKKGDRIAITGILTSRTYDDSEGNKKKVTEVLVNQFDYCSNKKSEEKPEEPKAEESGEQPQEGGTLPFEI